MKQFPFGVWSACIVATSTAIQADEAKVQSEVLEMKLPKDLSSVIWSVQNGFCIVQIVFPSVKSYMPPKKHDEFRHPQTKAWVLKQDGTSIQPLNAQPIYFGTENAMRVTFTDIYRFPAASKADAVAVVVSVDGGFFVGKITPEAPAEE